MEQIILPYDIYVIIFGHVNLVELIKLETLNKKIHLIIRTNNWPHITVHFPTIYCFNFVLNNYHFLNYDCNNTYLTDKDVLMLKHCHTLNLSGCKKITDLSVAKLKKCHTLNLANTNITNASVIKLGSCHTLNLSNNMSITNDGFAKLNKCHTLNLMNTCITDKGVVELKSCHTLNLAGTDISDWGLIKLKNCSSLVVCLCRGITNDTVYELQKYGVNVKIYKCI
jgi:hypothetical protein